MLNIGFSELLFLSFLVLIVIGPKDLPKVARSIIRFLNEMRRTTDEVKMSLHNIEEKSSNLKNSDEEKSLKNRDTRHDTNRTSL